jgi:ribosomal protein L11 methyltransferase
LISPGREWSPFTIGNRFYIKPADHTDDCPGLTTIVLGHGRAFGSGEHETTQHCLEIMTIIPFSPRQRILDFGTGTGILAIAAVRLHAEYVLALDIDCNAAKNAKENVRLNHLESQVEVVCGDIMCCRQSLSFDIILANIYADIILDRLESLTLHLNQQGYLLISGIHWDYIFDIKRRLAQLNYQIVSQKSGNEYNTLLFHKGGA